MAGSPQREERPGREEAKCLHTQQDGEGAGKPLCLLGQAQDPYPTPTFVGLSSQI